MAFFENAFMEQWLPKLEEALLRNLPEARQTLSGDFNEALRNAVFPGGKRLRPLCTLLTAEMLGGDAGRVLPLACAVEYLHSSSLIFDDLPSMDDAASRRDRPALHRAFGEDTAILVGLALLNQAYALLADGVEGARPESALLLVREAARCVGPAGMIGGQLADLVTRKNGHHDHEAESYVKTSSLMRLMFLAGALPFDLPGGLLEALGDYGDAFGRVFQAADDGHDRDGVVFQKNRMRESLDELSGAGETVIAHLGPDKRAVIEGLNHWLKETLTRSGV
jgi:geranylgeranyl pyrophosphate synthase